MISSATCMILRPWNELAIHSVSALLGTASSGSRAWSWVWCPHFLWLEWAHVANGTSCLAKFALAALAVWLLLWQARNQAVCFLFRQYLVLLKSLCHIYWLIWSESCRDLLLSSMMSWANLCCLRSSSSVDFLVFEVPAKWDSISFTNFLRADDRDVDNFNSSEIFKPTNFISLLPH